MVSDPRAVRCLFIVVTVVMSACLVAGGLAHAQAKLDAQYDITLGGIDVGTVTWSADIGATGYTTTATGEAAGLLSMLVSGHASVSTQGIVADAGVRPASFVAAIDREDEKARFSISFVDGVAQAPAGEVPPPGQERVPLTEADRANVSDPLSAFLIAVPGNGDLLGKATCERTLPVFDGRRRFDLVLAFKRMDAIKVASGYAGPVAVCALRFKPVAGYRPASRAVKYLSADRVVEVWLAPLAGSRMVAPVKLLIDNMIGDIEISASRFIVTDRVAQRDPAAQ